MSSVERVKSLCKERKIPISRLERDLGFSNGYVSQLRKGMFPADRLVKIADYLSVSVDYLLGEETEKAPTPEGERPMNVVKIAGRDGSFVEKRLSDEQIKALRIIIDQMPEAEDL